MYDYTGGKLDWLAAGLMTEGTLAGQPSAGTVARTEVPTCQLAESMNVVRERARGMGWDACVVVNQERVVFGLLRSKELAQGTDEPVERFMRPGPSTFRPHVSILEMTAHMVEHKLESSPITTSNGVLVGLLRREDAEAAVRRLHEEHLRHEHD